jgi:hypothetical protein
MMMRRDLILFTTLWIVSLLFLCQSSKAKTSSQALRRKRRKASSPDEISQYFKSLDQRNGGEVVTVIQGLEGELPDVAMIMSMSMNPSQPSVSPPAGAPSANGDDQDEQQRKEAMLDLLVNVTPEETLLNSATPQGKAFQWILNDDPAQIDPMAEPYTVTTRYGLAVLYYSTSGDGWKVKTNWLSGEDECTWFGVACHSGGEIKALELSNNTLVGELTGEIEIFNQVEAIRLYKNGLKGSLPETMTKLYDLMDLDVEDNDLSGNPFDSIYRLENLRTLRLSGNQFVGSLDGPTLRRHESLRELWIGDNLFEGTLASDIGRLQDLETLYIFGNMLSGTLPSTLGDLRLQQFLAQNNKFDGTVPETLYDNTDLTALRLDGNNLSGSISSKVGTLLEMIDFRIGNNTFSGTLPDALFRLGNLRTSYR